MLWLFMRVGRLVSIAGIVAMLSGVVFHLQGQAVVGPESSFMYSNPDWTLYGIQIAIAGMAVCIAGVVFRFLENRRSGH